MINNIKIGKMGEDIACEYLVKKKWKILKRNHHERSDEIDIIARTEGGILVFCEVKALKMTGDGSFSGLTPEDNLTSAKLRKISRACQVFAGKHPMLIDSNKGWRIDLIAIDIKGSGRGIGTAFNVRHYENI